MKCKAVIACLFAASVLATNAFSTSVHLLSQAPGAEYILHPNDPEIFANVFMWTVNATCKVSSPNENNPLQISVINKSGSFNGIPLTKGDIIDVIVHNSEAIRISAESGGKVKLENKGTVDMKVTCSAS